MKMDHLKEASLIAESVHPNLPERDEVFLEKFSLYPDGCLTLISQDRIVGYAMGHPWTLGHIPKLDSFLGKLPEISSCMHLHDIAILPEFRGGKSSFQIGYMMGLTVGMGLKYMTMVSVYGTQPLWERFGFIKDHVVDSKYGYDKAVYMTRKL